MTEKPAHKPRIRRGKTALIDPEEVRAMIAEGWSVAEVADHFDCSHAPILGICHDYGIPLQAGRRTLPPQGGQTFVKGPVKPRAEDWAKGKPAPVYPPREAELRATGGRYADLRAWAQKWGTTERKALQEWLKLRLPVAKGGAV